MSFSTAAERHVASAFTFIKLLLVVAIIGVLIALLRTSRTARGKFAHL